MGGYEHKHFYFRVTPLVVSVCLQVGIINRYKFCQLSVMYISTYVSVGNLGACTHPVYKDSLDNAKIQNTLACAKIVWSRWNTVV